LPLLLEWLQCTQQWPLYWNLNHIVSSSSVFGATHSLFINYFPKWNIETSILILNLKLLKVSSLIQRFFCGIAYKSSRYYRLELLGKLPKNTIWFW
jgi:hypothetical protein